MGVKSLSERKQLKLSGAFDFFEEISVLQINQSELAMIGLGEYEVSDSFKKYKFSPDSWNMMNSVAQKNAQNAFMRASCHHTDPGDFNITKLIDQNLRRKPRF